MGGRRQLSRSSPIDDMIARLPNHLAKHVKRTRNDEVEVQFSFSKMTDLQKLGMGIGDAEKLLVRLRPGGNGNPPGYCVHLSNERAHDNRDPHTLWLVQKNGCAPNDPYCQGIPNLISYQLSRKLFRDLEAGFVSLEDSYNSIASRLTDLPERCVVCGARHGVHLRRPAPCSLAQCQESFAAANYEIRIRDIWTNGPAIDLMLTAICAAAEEETRTAAELRMSHASHARNGGLGLLPGCPITKASSLRSLINRVPRLEQFGSDLFRAMMEKGEEFQLDAFMGRYIEGRSAQPLSFAKTLLWSCTSYGGFLTKAAGPYRIRAFDNHPQFLLANASPEIEQRFAVHMRAGNNRSRVLFHGTSLSRLHSILRGGLRSCSGTSLMSNGSYAGAGIYLTANPGIAYSYAIRRTFLIGGHTRTAHVGWKNSTFDTFGAFLACEFAWKHGGEPPSYKELKVVITTDPTTILIRYVILVPRFVIGFPPEIPSAREAIPQFTEAFRNLRSGIW